ncbi:phosphatase PAP2 family protein [Geodermatophilus sp. DSM 44513]|uniref:phosphatase PAP2 family protein n=1 Tax=Geodermatophilus sp. DSM 44513 TaxID=1528104 RepID=UPI0028F74DBA|nr:phosphatase PAP2 family protein [Geodermatophilus sp. DSM 44513]WNV74363.1 phosphatase PAP2 family protein [Geodermatophilus sp. DSM 44513]
MTRGAVRRRPGATPPGSTAGPVVSVGRPPGWLLAVSALVTVAVTADLLGGGVLERVDLRVSEVVSAWALADSGAYRPVWVVTQLGGRGSILVVLAGLVGYLGWRFRTAVPLVRVLFALLLLTVVVYSLKYGTGRTAPAYPGSFFHRDGASYPSGHVANAVLMWGVARWQVVEHRLAPWVQRTALVFSVAGPVATGVAMVCLDFHWVTDAVVGAAVGVLLLGVVHALDDVVLPRWAGARTARSSG